MARDPKSTGDGIPSPDERHERFKKENAAWDQRVKEKLERVEKAADKLKKAAKREPTNSRG